MTTLASFFDKIASFLILIIKKLPLSNSLKFFGVVFLFVIAALLFSGYQAIIEEGPNFIALEIVPNELKTLKEATLEELEIQLKKYNDLTTRTDGKNDELLDSRLKMTTTHILRLSTVIAILIPESKELHDGGRSYDRNKALILDILSKARIENESSSIIGDNKSNLKIKL